MARACACLLALAGLAPQLPGATPPDRGRPAVAARGEAINLLELNQRPQRPSLARRDKPTRGKLRFNRELPSVDTSLVATGTATRTQFADTSPSIGSSPSPGGFLPADGPPSPAASASFQAAPDDGTAFNPDSSGAVGTNHIMGVFSSAVQVLDRAGNPLSLVTLSNFWGNLGIHGNPDPFDPRVLYDPHFHRWIHVAIANPGTNDPGLLIAVSQTSDPTAGWNRYFIDTDLTIDVFPDSPNLGMTRDWIVVSANMFDRTNFLHASADIFVFEKAGLYGGAGSPVFTRFSRTDLGPPANVPVPAVTYEGGMTTNYLVGNWNGNAGEDGGFLRLYTIHSEGGVPVFTLGPFSFELPLGSTPWDTFSPTDDNFAPQAGTTNRIYLGDARIGNVVFRASPDANTLFLAQTVFVPAGGPATRTAVQWWEITDSAVVIQRGRIDDPAAGRFYAYPSVAVSRRNDVLVGYSRFSATQFPSANYAYRIDADLFSTLRDEVVLKAGEAKFFVDDFGINHWGDWSGAAVDPNNETDLWTLQQYASSPVNGTDRWGTWWGRVSPPSDLSITVTDSPDPAVAGSNVTFSVTLNTTNNKIQTVTGVRLQCTLPAGTVFVSGNPSQGSCGTNASNVLQCDFGTVGDTGRVTATLVLRLNNNGSINHTFTALANGPELTPLNNTVTVNTTVNPAAELAVSASAAPNPVTVSNQLTYSVTVTNRGPSTATSLQVTNTLPPGVAFISAQPSQGTCGHNAGIVTCSLGSLASLGAATIQISVRPNLPGNLTNRTTIGSAAFDAIATNNTALVITLANASPTLGFISDRTINEDSTLAAVAFTVGDLETPAADLTVTGSSSNPALVPNANIVFGGSGANRTVTVTPTSNASGVATITRIVTDALGATATNAFLLTVLPVNDPPTINNIPDLATDEDGATNVAITVSDIETPAASLSLSGISSNPTLVPNANLVFSGAGANRTLTITPAPNQSGSSTITVTVSDGTNTASDVFVLTVQEVNDAPTISVVTNRAVNEDTPTPAIAFTVGDVETPAAALIVAGFSANPTLVPNANFVFGGSGANRTVTITPGSNQFGVVALTLVVTDTNNASVSNSFQLTVNPVNDPPSLDTPPTRNVDEDSGLITVSLTGIGAGATNEVQSVTVTASSGNTAVIPNPTVTYSGGATGLLSFTPVLNANGSAVITLTATDDGLSNNVTTRTFTVNVNPVNDAPTLSDVADRTIDEDTSTGPVPVTVGDIESAATTLTLTGSSSDQSLVSNAGITFSGTGANRFVTIMPAPNANGACTITVTVSDGQATASDTFVLTVTPVSDPPSISPIADRSLNEDTTTNLTFTVGDLESPVASLSVAATSSNPALVPNANLILSGIGSTRSLAITPATNQFGTATLTLHVQDPDGGSNSTSFVLTVNPVNDPPSLAAIAEVTVDEDSPQQVVVLTGIGPGAANESQTLTLSGVSSAPGIIPNPVISYTNGSTTAVLRFTPVADAFGDVTLTVTVDDGAATNRTSSQPLVVHLLPLNDPPLISQPPPQTMQEDTTLSVPFTLVDLETAPGAITLAAISSNPELLLDADLVFGGNGTNRTILLRPLTNAFGSAEILVMATDGDGASASMFFEVTVQGVNDGPALSSLAPLSIDEDTLSPVVPFTIEDPDTLVSTLVVTASSSNPTLVPPGAITLSGTAASRSLRILPATNQFGTATITVSVSDGANAASNSFLLTVRSVNDLPSHTDIADQTIAEDGTAGPLAVTVGDLESAVGSLTLTGGSSDTALVPLANITFGGSGANRTVTVTPAPNRFGTATITVNVLDTDGGASADTFVLTVSPVNDPPTLTAIANVATNEDAGPVTVALAAISAGPFESQPLVVSASSSNPALIPNPQVNYTSPAATGSLTFTPATNASGSAVITVTVTDDGSASNTFLRSFTVTVNPVNDPPTLNPIANVTIAEDAPVQTVNLAGITSGAADEAQTLTLTATSGNPAVIPHPQVSYTSPATTGQLTFAPVANAGGSALITVTVQDGGNPNPSLVRTFTVTVTNVNDAPTLVGPGPQSMIKNTTTNFTFTVDDVDHTPGSLVVTAASSNTNLVPNASLVVSGTTGTRSISVTPATNRFGNTIITLTTTDGAGASASTTFTLTVSDATFPPTISDTGNQSAPEDMPVVIPFLIGDFETSATGLVVTVTSSDPAVVPRTGLLLGGSGANRTLTVQPLTNQVGPTTISITVTDPDGQSATDSFVLTFTNVNDLPTLSGLPNRAIDEDTATGPIAFTVGDVETLAANLNLTASSGNTTLVPNASLVLGGSGPDRTLAITPAANQSGTAVITVSLNDGNGGVTNRNFTLTVNAVNDPPTLDAISDRTVGEDPGQQTVSLAGISAGGGESQTINITATSSNPALIPHPQITYTSPNPAGSLAFTPAGNATGSVQITVSVNDGAPSNNLVIHTFTVTLTPANDAPTLAAIANQSMNEDGILSTTLTVGDAETPAAGLVVSATAADSGLLPASGILFSGSDDNRTLTLIPAPNRYGTTVVSVAVTDGIASSTNSFTLGVAAVNDPPSMDGLTNAQYVASPGSLTIPLRGIGAGGTNETDSPITLSVTHTFAAAFWSTAPTVSYSGGTTGLLSFRPANNQTGTGTVSVIVNDGRGSNNLTTRSFLLAVRASANIQPTISVLGPQSVNEDAVLGPLAVTVRDSATAAASLVLTGVSSNQAVIPNAGIVLGGSGTNRTVTITPASNASGSSLVTLTVFDNAAGFSNMTFNVTVNPVNDPPGISPIANLATGEDTPTGPIAVNVSDPETAAAALTVTAVSGNTALVPNGNVLVGGSGTNRALVLTPAPNQSGSALITVTVSDGTASTNTSFTLTVNATNDPPTVSDVADVAMAEDTTSAPIGFVVGDVETAAGSLTVSALSSNPALLPVANITFGGSGANRTVTLAPVTNLSGSATVTLNVSDGTATVSDTFVVTVTPVNDPPTLNAIGNFSLNQGASQQTVALAGIGAGGAESQTLVVAASSSNPALIPHPGVTYTSPNSTGNLTFTPIPGAHGTATITVTVNDGQPLNPSVTRTFTVTVNGAPTLSVIPNQVVNRGASSPAIPFTVSDPESAAASLTISASSSNPALIPGTNVVLGGSGTNRTVTLTPLAGQTGFATITVAAVDPQGNSNTCSFLLTVVSVNEPPQLWIELAGNFAVVSWPSTAGDAWKLQTTTNLSSPILWRTALASPAVVGDRYRVTNSLAGPRKFYRLCDSCEDPSEPPTLSIARSGQGIVLTWPLDAAGFQVEGRTSVTAAWMPVPGTPVIANGQYNLTLPATGPMQIFRLRQP